MRWSNVPIPEPHVAGLAAAFLLGTLRPWRLRGFEQLGRVSGAVVALSAVGLAGWAVRAAADVEMERSRSLVTRGPYGRTRNPMYVAWTALYLGAALRARNAWAIGALPVVLLLQHRMILREEGMLMKALPEKYDRYRERVGRYW